MAKELTRTGVVGLELTREEVIDLLYAARALENKAACREVNCDVIDALHEVSGNIGAIYTTLTEILESGE